MGVDGGVVAIGIPRQRLNQIIVCVIDVFLPHDGNKRVRVHGVAVDSDAVKIAANGVVRFDKRQGDQIVGAAYRLLAGGRSDIQRAVQIHVFCADGGAAGRRQIGRQRAAVLLGQGIGL